MPQELKSYIDKQKPDNKLNMNQKISKQSYTKV